jgi:hypothetical protein
LSFEVAEGLPRTCAANIRDKRKLRDEERRAP